MGIEPNFHPDDVEDAYIYNDIQYTIKEFGYSYLNKFPDREKQLIRDAIFAFNKANELLSSLRKKIDAALNHTTYIGPFRSNPERIYRRKQIPDNSVGRFGENAINMLINGFLRKDEALISSVSQQLNNAYHYSLNISELGNNYFQILLEDSSKQKNNIIDVGYGISQILPIITQIAKEISSYNYYLNSHSS